MNPLKQELIARLRSGKYRQIFGHLHDCSDGYCAEGVMMEIWREKQDGLRWEKCPMTDGMKIHYKRGYYFTSAPMDIEDLFDVSLLHLWRLNDLAKLTFNQIADKIEEMDHAKHCTESVDTEGRTGGDCTNPYAKWPSQSCHCL